MSTLRTSSPAATAVKGEKEGEEGIVEGCIPIYSSTCLHVCLPWWEGSSAAALLPWIPWFVRSFLQL